MKELYMKNTFIIIVMMMFSLLFTSTHTAGQNAKGCMDHPLIPKMPEYYIIDCNDVPAEADIDIIRGDTTETVHFKGKSSVYMYMPQSDAKTKLSETELLRNFLNGIQKMNGILFGITYGQKWPVYTLEKDGKKYWIILLVNSGEYYTGSYTCRIIEND